MGQQIWACGHVGLHMGLQSQACRATPHLMSNKLAPWAPAGLCPCFQERARWIGMSQGTSPCKGKSLQNSQGWLAGDWGGTAGTAGTAPLFAVPTCPNSRCQGAMVVLMIVDDCYDGGMMPLTLTPPNIHGVPASKPPTPSAPTALGYRQHHTPLGA